MVGDHDYMDNLLKTLPDKYQLLARQSLQGDFFSFYLCDLFLKLNGKEGQPVYVKLAGQSTGRCRRSEDILRAQSLIVGGIGIAVTAAVLVAALNYDQLPLLSTDNSYSAYFSDAAGLKDDALVQVSGVKAGQVVGITLDGDKVLVQFRVSDGIRIGERSEGSDQKQRRCWEPKVVQVTPKGTGH